MAATTWTTWTSTSSTTNGTDTWNAWADDSTTATSSSESGTWTVWTDSSAETTTIWIRWGEVEVQPPSPEEIEAQKRIAEQEREERERAEKLLREHLTKQQAAQLEKEGGFEVEAQSGKEYLITRGRQGNVYSLDAKRRKVARHCIHPEEFCPDPDTMLAQLCWLKWNETEFLKVANTTPLAA
jgi:hypothetical protein